MARSFSFTSVARSHRGRVRRLNEDRFLDAPKAGLWAVADGMGGHQAGDVAAELTVEGLAELGAFGSGYAHLTAVCERLQRINDELRRRAAERPAGSVIGATVVALLVHEDHYACVWAGDSRAYLLRNGQLEQITRDHSLVQDLVDSGAIRPEEARGHRHANVITRAVGAQANLAPDLHNAALEPGDLFLLCSDGLTGALEDAEIAEVLGRCDLESAADELLQLTLDRGARDNVTLLLVAASA